MIIEFSAVNTKEILEKVEKLNALLKEVELLVDEINNFKVEIKAKVISEQ